MFSKLTAFFEGRSPKWPDVEKAFRKLHPDCQACTSKDALNVHHIKPFHKFPALELDTMNLITLCRRCHFFLGHLDDWSSWNVDVVANAAMMLGKIKTRPV